MAVALTKDQHPSSGDVAVSSDMRRRLTDTARSMAPSQQFVRGIFSGGTFCFEAQLVHAADGITAYSNAPTDGNQKLEQIARSQDNTIIDMGDDDFTQGRPHPMIDPSLRDMRIQQEIDDPTTAVVLVDVVLGYGSSLEPVSGLLGIIGSSRAAAKAAGRTVVFICYVCGTDADPQPRKDIVAALKTAGALVASSNAEAAAWSATVIAERQKVRS